MSTPRSRSRFALAAAAWLALAATPSIAEDETGAAPERVVSRPLPGGHALVLSVDATGNGHLFRIGADDLQSSVALACDPLPGAWGMWIDDVDRDGASEVLVAMRKPARFDPVAENRLHVYALVDDRCVPLWRGSRLAGRFDALAVGGGRLLALERIGRGQRWIARYRWTGFGYAVDRVLWRGAGEPPARLRRRLEPGDKS
jgi:hypothetical protein